MPKRDFWKCLETVSTLDAFAERLEMVVALWWVWIALRDMVQKSYPPAPITPYFMDKPASFTKGMIFESWKIKVFKNLYHPKDEKDKTLYRGQYRSGKSMAWNIFLIVADKCQPESMTETFCFRCLLCRYRPLPWCTFSSSRTGKRMTEKEHTWTLSSNKWILFSENPSTEY